MTNEDFTPDVKMTPYWWETSPREETVNVTLPSAADVVVVRSGYTGLNAALQMARGGRHVVVCDAEAAGWGGSTRNGGMISTSVKPDLKTLTRRHGSDVARQVMQDGRDSLNWIKDFVDSESIDCDFKVVGRFHVAHNQAAFRKLTDTVINQPAGFEVPAHVVSRDEQRTELGTDSYHGGVVFPDHASIDPGRYHAGLLERVRAAGVTNVPYCKVTAIARDGSGFDVETGKGRIRARDVVIATNAYSGPLSRWHQRRIIPIGSYVIATEQVPEALMNELIPKNRIISDTRRVPFYFRATPDRRRILFGGRLSINETDPRRTAAGCCARNSCGCFQSCGRPRCRIPGWVLSAIPLMSWPIRGNRTKSIMPWATAAPAKPAFLPAPTTREIHGFWPQRSTGTGFGTGSICERCGRRNWSCS